MTMTHREALEVLCRHRGRHIVITTHGSVDTWVRLSDTALDVAYVPASMGQAPGLGLGLALAQSRHGVIVVCGDGHLLMNLGCLVTLAAHPAPLYLLIIDNGVYEVTGGQAIAGAGRTDFAGLAGAAGIPRVYTCPDAAAWEAAAAGALSGPGPVVMWLKVAPRAGQVAPRDAANGGTARSVAWRDSSWAIRIAARRVETPMPGNPAGKTIGLTRNCGLLLSSQLAVPGRYCLGSVNERTVNTFSADAALLEQCGLQAAGAVGRRRSGPIDQVYRACAEVHRRMARMISKKSPHWRSWVATQLAQHQGKRPNLRAIRPIDRVGQSRSIRRRVGRVSVLSALANSACACVGDRGPLVVALDGTLASLTGVEFMVFVTGVPRPPKRLLRYDGNRGVLQAKSPAERIEQRRVIFRWMTGGE